MRSIFILLFFFSSSLLLSQSGTLDSLFGVNGKVQTNILGGSDYLNAMIIQPDQKIVVAGAAGTGTNATITVARYMPDGSLDGDFGGSGIISIDYTGTVDRATSIALQPDGKIVVGAETTSSGNTNFSVVRLLENGTPDAGFGTGGRAIIDFGVNFEASNAVAVQPDGKIVLAGRVESATFSDFAVARFTDSGSPDEDFSEDGKVTTSLHDEDDGQSLVLQPDGKIVVGGYTAINATGDYAMVRYLEDGTLDKFFGVGGKVITDVDGEGRSDLAWALISDSDQKLVLAGFANFTAFPLGSEIGVVRYSEDGEVDSTFADNGRFILKLGEQTHIFTITQQPDGKYILGGDSDVDFGAKWIVARLLNEGVLDPNFGDGGKTLIDFNGSGRNLTSLDLQQDGKIVAAGIDNQTSPDFALARLKNDLVIGTKDLEEFTGIDLFPNPANHGIYIHSESILEDISLQIMDVKGDMMLAKTGIHLSPYGVNLDVSYLPQGIYFVRMENKEGRATLPFTKIK